MASLRTGKCTNFGLCAKADTREAQHLPEGADFICGECQRPLTVLATAAGGGGGSQLLGLGVIGGLVLLALVGGSLFFFRGCGGGAKTPDVAPNLREKPQPSAVTPVLKLSGSNTIGAELAVALAEAWLTQRGATDVQHESSAPEETRITGVQAGQPVVLEIKAHGSGTAFPALAEGSADVGMASRPIKREEAALLSSKGLGDLTSNANERVVALDGVAVIVHETNPIDGLTKNEVADIFSGVPSVKGRNWNVYTRDDKSGTFDTFKDRVLGARALVSSARRFGENHALAQAVASDPQGIGFVGLSATTGAKVLAIAESGTAYRVPNINTVRTEAYPLTRRLYLYLTDASKPEARDFVRFALSGPGQDIVQKSGLVGQKVEVIKANALPSDAPKGYAQLAPSSERLSLDFRFRTGSSELDTKATDDIKRVSALLASSEYAGRGLMLVGFADSTGSAALNTKLSKQRADAVAAQMQQLGVAPVLVTGFGAALPVADNGTPEGREKNRRVEVWLQK